MSIVIFSLAFPVLNKISILTSQPPLFILVQNVFLNLPCNYSHPISNPQLPFTSPLNLSPFSLPPPHYHYILLHLLSDILLAPLFNMAKYLNPVSSTFSVIDHLMQLFLFMSSIIMPLIYLSILISLCYLHFCSQAFEIEYVVSAPWSIAGHITILYSFPFISQLTCFSHRTSPSCSTCHPHVTLRCTSLSTLNLDNQPEILELLH